ncbi:hypothetical protein OGH69_03570 [Flavobacterium sp. MFBS3-15]|uniref:DUF6705 family protein n=1 Tax=Flavobacterium sp. MFBS3-15 TaxID=2989816 RepID=UPI0022360618|nr:DUF6705 family protein [Flavobacterium sp. MFBS3-15]MCW4468033.1 hypothetical protein [Flavobacterium sp. MFBS3-15]
MKAIFIIALLFGMGCRAQTPIKSLYEDDTDISGAYYKDLYNDLDNFVGTWKYTDGTTSLTITLEKREMQVFNNGKNHYYADFLVGEYKYIENGVEIINTLPRLTSNIINPWNFNIVGNIIVGPNSQYCLNCGPNDRKVVLGFNDPTRDIFGFEPEMIFQRADDGSTQKLRLIFRNLGSRMSKFGETTLSPYTSYNIPFGEYLLVKQ